MLISHSPLTGAAATCANYQQLRQASNDNGYKLARQHLDSLQLTRAVGTGAGSIEKMRVGRVQSGQSLLVCSPHLMLRRRGEETEAVIVWSGGGGRGGRGNVLSEPKIPSLVTCAAGRQVLPSLVTSHRRPRSLLPDRRRQKCSICCICGKTNIKLVLRKLVLFISDSTYEAHR